MGCTRRTTSGAKSMSEKTRRGERSPPVNALVSRFETTFTNARGRAHENVSVFRAACGHGLPDAAQAVLPTGGKAVWAVTVGLNG